MRRDHHLTGHHLAGHRLAEQALAEQVLAWYRQAARDLPWRRPGAGPWAILVSEVMLQQTPVPRVLPVYSTWLRRWPDPSALAADSPGEAIRAWGRLGYPRRALRLHAAATKIDREHRGRVPDDLGALRALPGVGAYTAAAVASFAFGRRHPVLDTNVGRVLTRLFADGARPADSVQRHRLERTLPADPAVAALTSVALMELGALVCTASDPACESCPLRTQCRSGCGVAASGSQAVPDGGAAPPPRRTSKRRQPNYRGSVREARGLLLGAVRDAPRPLGTAELKRACPDGARRARALSGLLADGLLLALPDGTYTLP